MLKLFALLAIINGEVHTVDHGLTKADCETARLLYREVEIDNGEFVDVNPAMLECTFDLEGEAQ